MFDNRTSRCLFSEKLSISKVFSRIKDAIFDVLQEILDSHPFSEVTKVRNAGLPLVRSQTD